MCVCVRGQVVCAAATSEERSKWVKALNKTFKELRAQAPTSGWLMKQGGRVRRQSLEPRSFAPPLEDHSVLASRWWQARTGLMKALSKNRRRWFVLVQPEEGADAVFRYYDAPPPSLATPPKGFVIINNKARLQTEVGSPLGRNVD